MSLFAEYLKELDQKGIIEDADGFATFYEFNGGMYIEDIFVRKDKRNMNKASQYADQIALIAKNKGMSKLYGSVRPTAKTSSSALKVLLAYGFKLDSSMNDAIIFVKEI